MLNTLPDSIDPWRSVQGRRVYQGSLPLTSMQRLLGLLASAEGKVNYKIEFGSDEFDIAFVDISVNAGLPMTCQRLMKGFLQPVVINQRLGLIRDEAHEAGLPEGYEPLLVTDDRLCLKDVIEDELILSLPLVALSPGAPLEQVPVTIEPASEENQPPNPFAVLGQLKKTKH